MIFHFSKPDSLKGILQGAFCATLGVIDIPLINEVGNKIIHHFREYDALGQADLVFISAISFAILYMGGCGLYHATNGLYTIGRNFVTKKDEI